MSPQRQRMVVIGLGVVCVAGVAFAFVVRESSKHTHPVSALVRPVTVAQAGELVEPLASALGDCGASLDALADPDALTAIALGNDDHTAAELTEASAGVVRALTSLLCADPTAVRSVLGVRDRPTGAIIMVRITDVNGADYVELELGARNRDARVVVIDALDLRSGIRLSRNEREFVGLAVKLSMPLLTRAQRTLADVQQAIADGELDRARELIEQFPAAIRPQQGVRALEVASLEGPALVVARDRYLADFPDAILLAFISASDHGDHAAARRAVDRVEQRVGQDAFLDIQRSYIEADAGNGEAAIAAATRATSREPGLREAWDAKVYASAGGGDTAAAVLALDEIERRFAVRFTRDQIETDPQLKALVASLDYKVWVSMRPRER